jgi:predicted metalloendopeptidase
LGIAIALAACGGKAEPAKPMVAATAEVPAPSAPQSAPPMSPPSAPMAASHGIDKAGMDTGVKPGDDFFKFANGTWIATTEIPPDRAQYGTGAILDELTNRRVRELIENAAKTGPTGSEAAKVGEYYATFMDEAAIEKAGYAPLQPQLDAIAAIKTKADLTKAIGESLRADVDVLNNTNYDTTNLFGIWIAQDLNDPTKYAVFVLQGGLGLPDRDYYLDASPRMKDARAGYAAHVAAMLKLAGTPADKVDGIAARVVALETKIAKAHAPRTETEDVAKGNNHMTRKQLAARAPGIDWKALFEAAQLGAQQDFVVWQPHAVTALAKLVGSEPVDDWKAWMQYHAIEQAAPFLSKAFVDESFAFYGKQLAGVQQLRDRWKRGVAATDNALGEAVGKLYVAKYFPPEEKARAEQMVKNELAAFAKRIDNLTWMAPATKEKAKAKLAALKVGVGYPDSWRDFSGLEVVKGDALGNALRAEKFEYQRNLAKLGKPVDRGEWVMNPQLVNAVNLPAMNALNFPAAILQPPFFDPNRPIVMDYGSTGATIGHEISHSFDDQGALFDATGRLENWWTKSDFAHFKASSAALAAQYDGYQPFPDAHVNGKLTSSENIADTAGLSAAYDAYRISEGGKEAPTVDGMTGDQQFFLSFAQSWRTKTREAAARNRLLTDGHAPAEYRADTVRNLDAWYTAFDVKPAEKLYVAPDKRVHVW